MWNLLEDNNVGGKKNGSISLPLISNIPSFIFRGPVWLHCKVFGSPSWGLGFEPHWIFWVLRGSILGQDNSEPKLIIDETQERHE